MVSLVLGTRVVAGLGAHGRVDDVDMAWTLDEEKLQ